jgi:hypothetical protein
VPRNNSSLSPRRSQSLTELIKRHLPPRRLRFRFDCKLKRAAGAAGKPTSLGKTGVKSLISQGADVSQFEKQARAAGVQLGQKAQSAVDRAQVQQIAAAPASLGSQVRQIAKATDSGKITQSAVKALISSGTSAKQIEKVAAKQGVDIGKQAQQLINKAQNKKKNR